MSRPIGLGPASTHEPLLAIILAFNEAGNVGRVVTETLSLATPVDVLVIDDGSTDETADVAERAGATVISLPFNCGIGAGAQVGLRFGLNEGYSLIVRLDGDGQHDPRAVASLSSRIASSGADFVLGTRFLERRGYQSTSIRRLGARWFSYLLRMVCGLRITDPTSGLWVANRRAASVLAEQYSADYPEVDSLVRLQRSGCVIAECPVEMRPRLTGSSSISLLNGLYYMCKVTIALLVGRVQPRAPLIERKSRWDSRSTKQSPF